MKKSILLSLFLIGGIMNVNAQEKDNEPLPGVSLPVDGGWNYPGLKPPPPPRPRTPEQEKQKEEERRRKAEEEYQKAKQLIAK